MSGLLSVPIAKKREITEQQVRQVKLTFGKHRNKSLMDVPVDYLQWLQTEKLADGENTGTYFMQCLDFAIRNSKAQ